MSERVATNVTHLLWVGRWIEVVRTDCPPNGPGWGFKNGRDAADWLMWSPPRPSRTQRLWRWLRGKV